MPNNNRKRHYNNKGKRPTNSAEIEAAITAHEMQYSAQQLSLTLENLNLSEPTIDLLTKGRISTAADLIRRTEYEMYKVQGLNKKVLWELKDALRAQHMSFREPPPMPEREQKSTSDTKHPTRAADGERPAKIDDNPRTGSKFGLDSRDVQSQGERRREGNRDENGDERRGRDERRGGRDNRDNSDTRENGVGRRNNRGERNDRQRQGRQPQKQAPPKPEKLTEPLPVDEWRKIMKGGKWGFSDGFKTVIPPIYDEVFSFKDGLASVEIDEKCGYIDSENNIVIPLDYDTAMSFSEGLASVVKGDKCGYINKENEVVLPFEYDAATAFENGEAKIKKDGKWGTITTDGHIVWI